MTLASIMRLALRQMEEDPEDIEEFADLLRTYANLGYRILVTRYFMPRQTLLLHTDERGEATVEGMGIESIVSCRDSLGRHVPCRMSADGMRMETGARDEDITAVCIVPFPPLERDEDEPRIPEHAHPALADYICYSVLLNGNAAKQSRAMAYLQRFEQIARSIRAQGAGSVNNFTNLYSASDIRAVRW